MTESQLFKSHFETPLRKHFGSAICIEKLPGSEYKKGLPDYLICLRGSLILVEAKLWDNPHRDGTPLQRHFLKSFLPSGGSGMVVCMENDRSFTCKATAMTESVREIASALNVTCVGSL